jgi:hypothetical protein
MVTKSKPRPKRGRHEKAKRQTRALQQILLGGALSALVLAIGLWFLSTEPPVLDAGAIEADLVVYTRPNCSCCEQWVEQVRNGGMTVEVRDAMNSSAVRSTLGVPDELRSCHTAQVGDQWIEGHVPVDLVKEVVQNKLTDIQGIAVPGMPIGSPGMEGPNAEPFQVMQVSQDGTISVYTQRPGATSAPE